jgi:hypothetical protein
MIDLTQEQLISLVEATRFIPAARQGKSPPNESKNKKQREETPRVNASTVFRWAMRGVRGPSGECIRLEVLRVGSRLMTSIQALQRFFEASTPRSDARPSFRPPSLRRKHAEAAGRRLARAGI